MGAFGVGLLFSSVAAVIGYLLADHGSGMLPKVPKDVPKGDGNAGQSIGPTIPDVPDVTKNQGTGAFGAVYSGQPSRSVDEKNPEPVTPPKSGMFVPAWSNPDSAHTTVD